MELEACMPGGCLFHEGKKHRPELVVDTAKLPEGLEWFWPGEEVLNVDVATADGWAVIELPDGGRRIRYLDSTVNAPEVRRYEGERGNIAAD